MSEPARPIKDSDPRLRQLADLRAGNVERMREIGQPLVSQLVDTTKLRLQTLIDLIFDDEDRLAFELEFERRCGEMLAQAQPVAQRIKTAAVLGGGLPAPNGKRQPPRIVGPGGAPL
jgi:hypothetical protein